MGRCQWFQILYFKTSPRPRAFPVWYAYSSGTGGQVPWLDLRFQIVFLPHIRYLKNKSTKALNLIRVVAHTSWGTDQDILLLLYTSLISSKLDYGCIVYGCARSSYLLCWTQYKIMLFVYAWVLIEPHHHQAFAYLQMNLLYTYDAKNSLHNILFDTFNFQP